MTLHQIDSFLTAGFQFSDALKDQTVALPKHFPLDFNDSKSDPSEGKQK